MNKHLTSEQRFTMKVDKNGPVHPILQSRCWMWTAGNIRGYGHFWYNGKTVKATRFALIMSGVTVSNDVLVLHKCDNPRCVNPDHLFTGTHQDNRADCVRKNRQARANTSGRRTKPERWLKGEKAVGAKLTNIQVTEIRKIYKYRHSENGTSGLARRYGVAQGTIWRIVSRNARKHG